MTIGVTLNEIDRSQAIRIVDGDSVGAVLRLPYGPITPREFVAGDEETFLNAFTENGIPNPSYRDYYEGLIMLKNGSLTACRPIGDAVWGGLRVKVTGTGNEPVGSGAITNPSTYVFPSGTQFILYGADPSALNNNYSAKVYASTSGINLSFNLDIKYNGTSIGIFLVSLSNTAVDGFGNSIYIENVLKNRFDVAVRVNTAADLTVLPQFSSGYVSFTGGSTITTFATPSITTAAWDHFKSYNKYPVHILADTSCDPTIGQYVNDIALEAWYQVVYLGVPSIKATSPLATESLSTFVTNAIAYRDVNGVLLSLNSDHSTLYANWGTVTDSYNNTPVWVSPVGLAVSRKLFTLKNISLSAAATGANSNRGVLNEVVELEQDVTAVIDQLGDAQINCLTYSPAGPVVWNEWTLQTSFSNTSYVSHRYLFNIVEEQIESNLFYFVFTDISPVVRDDLKRFVQSYTDTLIGTHFSEVEVRVPQDNLLEQQRKLKVQVAVRPYAKANLIIFEFLHAGPGGIALSEVF